MHQKRKCERNKAAVQVNKQDVGVAILNSKYMIPEKVIGSLSLNKN